ncbi:MAG: phosphoglycolate phosphatase [Pseudomonadota bacterium]
MVSNERDGQSPKASLTGVEEPKQSATALRPIGNISTVIFDLDGTLIDSALDLLAALNRVLAEFNRPPQTREMVVGMIGNGAAKLVERALEATGGLVETRDGEETPFQRFMHHYKSAPAVQTAPYPGVEDALEALAQRGVHMAVCTNKPHALSVTILEALGLSRFFRHVSGGDSVPVRKPHPGHLLSVMQALGVNRAEVAMVGDSITDVTAAKAVPIPVVAVTYGYSKVPVNSLGADFVIDSFATLPLALAAVGR